MDYQIDKKTTMRYCQVITKPHTFRRFPVEIREPIFAKAVDWDCKLSLFEEIFYCITKPFAILQGQSRVHDLWKEREVHTADVSNLFYEYLKAELPVRICI
jgi:hypothetical protein